jgi:acetyl-CoA/propionyl-CoA carboxylase biotin carboxyl carrier protein
VHMGLTDASLMWDYHTWVEELGEALVGRELHDRLGEKAVELTRAIGWTGVGRVRWAITPDGGWYMLGFSGRLTTGYSLVEQVVGTDLVQTQLRLAAGEQLGWQQADVQFPRHGVELRLFPFDMENPGERPTGSIERLVLPEGDEHVRALAGTAEGQPVTSETDPLLAKITVTGPTRHAALVRARAVLADLAIEGVPTNKELLSQLLADEAVWRGEYDDHTVARILSAGAVG